VSAVSYLVRAVGRLVQLFGCLISEVTYLVFAVGWLVGWLFG
jgi:hypothetical protein